MNFHFTKADIRQGRARLQSVPGVATPFVRWSMVIIAPILAWIMLFSPYLDWRDQQQQLVHAHAKKAARILALKASGDQWLKASEAYGNTVKQTAKALFQASSYAASQAALLELIHASLTEHHLVLGSQHLLDEKKEDHLGQQVAVHFRVRGDLIEVLRFVDAMARQPKLLLLDHLYIGKDPTGQTLLQFQATGFRMGSDDAG